MSRYVNSATVVLDLDSSSTRQTIGAIRQDVANAFSQLPTDTAGAVRNRMQQAVICIMRGDLPRAWEHLRWVDSQLCLP